MPETRRDRALRVATAHVIATGVRGISRENRRSKEPLYLLLDCDVNLADYMAELKTHGNTTIHLSQVTGNRGNANVELSIGPEDKFEIIAHGITESESWKGRDLDNQLNRVLVLRRFNSNKGISLRDLEERIETEVGKDPLFGKAIVYEGDDRVLLETIDAQNFANGIYTNPALVGMQKVAKSPLFYQAVTIGTIYGLFALGGQDAAETWNNATSHGVGKAFHDFMVQFPIYSGMAKVAVGGWAGGLVGRTIGNAGRGLNTRNYLVGKTGVFNPKAMAKDVMLWGALGATFYPLFVSAAFGGDAVSSVFDETSKLIGKLSGDIPQQISYALNSNNTWWNPGINITTGVGDNMASEPVLFTLKTALRSLTVCGLAYYTLFNFKGKGQAALDVMFGDVKPNVRKELLEKEFDNAWKKFKYAYQQVYHDPMKAAGRLASNKTLLFLWPFLHWITMSSPKELRTLISTIYLPLLPAIMQTNDLAKGRSQDIYQRRVSPGTYEVLTGRTTTTPA